MRILVIGSGGREHALCWKIRQSPLVKELFCAPGNAGINKDAKCVDISATEIDKLLQFVKRNNIDLTVVGPEMPLTLGLVDVFEKEGLKVFGPSKAAAELEGSKIFSKNFMKRHMIPTAEYRTFADCDEARRFIRTVKSPFVVKADGLASGKGVVLCNSIAEGEKALNSIMLDRVFGEAGDNIIIEEFLRGQEASIFVITDGEKYLVLEPSQDHKAVYNDDKGPNTGGMGAYCPAPIVTKTLLKVITSKIVEPTLHGMASEAKRYKGVLYIGLMINGNDIRVLEYNCRFGDPETQPVLFKMKTDIIPIMDEVAEGKLTYQEIEYRAGAAVCVVMASKGYPGKYEKGIHLSKINLLKESEDVAVFHAGTKLDNGNIVTNGGRVLGVTCIGNTIEDAVTRVYKEVSFIDDGNLHYRMDIGNKAVRVNI